MLGTDEGDKRVRVLLDELQLQYWMAGSDFEVLISFEDGRTQRVLISSKTYQVGHLEVREVVTVGLDSEAPFHADIANALLLHNSEVPIGAWRLHRHEYDGGCGALFVVQVAADTTASTLEMAVLECAKAGDIVEERFTGEDFA